MDEPGYVYLLGRKDEMIISGGYNIAPRRDRGGTAQHPAVLDAAVVGEKDPEWGQIVVAYVVRRRPDVTEAELIEATKAEARFQAPEADLLRERAAEERHRKNPEDGAASGIAERVTA